MADLGDITTFQPDNTTSFTFFQLEELASLLASKSNNSYLVITPHQYASFAKYLYYLQCLIAAGGMLGNALCVRTFLKIGLKDSVTVTFFSIAVSDIVSLVMIVLMAAYYLNDIAMIEYHYDDAKQTFSYYNTIFGLDPALLFSCVTKVYDVSFFVSSSLITFLAVQRSLCVLLPIRFKGMFTRRRTVASISMIWGYWMTIFITEWSMVRFNKVDHGYAPNATRITMKAHSDSPTGMRFNRYRWLVNYTIIPTLFIVAVLGGVFVMTHALTASVRFRQSATSGGGETPAHNDTKRQNLMKLGNEKKSPSNVDEADTKQKLAVAAAAGTVARSKESQAIMQVAILSAFFLLSQLPAIAWNIGFLLRPDLRKSVYFYLRELCKNAYIIMDTANASVNFLVYYRFNTKFRRVCFQRKP